MPAWLPLDWLLVTGTRANYITRAASLVWIARRWEGQRGISRTKRCEARPTKVCVALVCMREDGRPKLGLVAHGGDVQPQRGAEAAAEYQYELDVAHPLPDLGRGESCRRQP